MLVLIVRIITMQVNKTLKITLVSSSIICCRLSSVTPLTATKLLTRLSSSAFVLEAPLLNTISYSYSSNCILHPSNLEP